MQNRVYGWVAVFAVVGVSVAFGIILGGKLDPPSGAPAGPLELPSVASAGCGTGGFADIVERVLPAVVGITSSKHAKDAETNPQQSPLDDPFFRRFFGDPENFERHRPRPGPQIGAGSGFIIAPEGYILTNHHVVEDFEKVEVRLQNGTRYAAKVVGADPSIDLALLKIDPRGERLPALSLGNSDGLRVGEWVIAIGNPLDFEQTVTVGVVSGKDRRLLTLPTDSGLVSFIQTDAAINFGNSGGPLLDSSGNVVGINTAIRRSELAEGIGFALPINQARAVVEQLRQNGSVRRGYVGILMNANGIDQTTAEYYGLPDTNGVLVSNVTAGGPADQAGLQRGDIIREVEGEKVRDKWDLITKIASRKPGETVRLSVLRQGKPLQVRAKLGDREQGLAEENGEGSQGTPQDSGGDRERPPQQTTALGLTVETPRAGALERLGFDTDRKGVLITDVELGSEAMSKGIEPNLLIVAVNDKATPDVTTWSHIVEGLKPGAPVKLDALGAGPRGEQPFYFFLRVPSAGD